jgi:ring-1,2-phenylacetyl-CoA epoxidase subunit PaaE
MELIIQEVKRESKDAVTLMLKRSDGLELRYEAGQFITLVFPTPFGEKRRSYSFSSAPSLGETPAITIKRVVTGEFSRKLVEQTRPGDRLQASAVSGLFKLTSNWKEISQHIFFAAGSGITPCFSLIKTILHDSSREVVLIYSNKNREQAIFHDKLIELQRAYPDRFQLRFLFSDLLDVFNSRLSKWLLPQLLEQYLKTDCQHIRCYLCGPWDYMRMVQLTLLAEGIPMQAIHKENFDTLPRLHKPAPPDKEAHEVLIREGETNYRLRVQYPQTILAAAKEKGIQIPFSCEAGRCGSCVATCTKGKVWMAYNEVLMDEEVSAGRFLSCQAYPVGGDIEIRLD